MCVDARVRACMCMYVGYDVGVSCVATVVCLWLQLCLIKGGGLVEKRPKF